MATKTEIRAEVLRRACAMAERGQAYYCYDRHQFEGAVLDAATEAMMANDAEVVISDPSTRSMVASTWHSMSA